jgi:hypothetical protein
MSPIHRIRQLPGKARCPRFSETSDGHLVSDRIGFAMASLLLPRRCKATVMIRTISSWMLVLVVLSPIAAARGVCDFSSTIAALVSNSAFQPASTPAIPGEAGEGSVSAAQSCSVSGSGIVAARLKGATSITGRLGDPAYGAARPANAPTAPSQQITVLRI